MAQVELQYTAIAILAVPGTIVNAEISGDAKIQTKSRKQSAGGRMENDPDLEVGASDSIREVILLNLQGVPELPVYGIVVEPRLWVYAPAFVVAA